MKRLKTLWAAAGAVWPSWALLRPGGPYSLARWTLVGNFALTSWLHAAGSLKEKTVTLEKAPQYTP